MKMATSLRVMLLVLFQVAAAGARADAPWPAGASNPKPMPDDFVLPMPCGGQMAFRPVFVPGRERLDDQRITMGGVDKQYGYKEYQHAAYIGGGFSAEKGDAGRLYYLGKYDVTRLQFAALDATCPTPDDSSPLPQTSITWTQAVDFAAAYNGWLIAHAKDKLPTEAGQPGFLRLPTEQEWEYAARGGARVSPADFAAPLFPMAKPLVQYVWYNGTESSNGKLQPIGLLLPNPLGLFDMLGDAAQLTAGQFRLNRLSRLNGDAGGQITRGGSYLTPQDQIRTAERDEFVPYDSRGERRLKSVGFRLALAAPALPNLAALRKVEAEWASLPNSDGGTLAEPVQDNPVKEMQLLADAVGNPALKQRLERIEGIIAANIKTRNDQRDRAVRANLALASWLATKMRTDARHLLAQQHVAWLGKMTSSPAIIRTRQELDSSIAAYRDALRSLYTEYSAPVRDAQSSVLRGELGQQGKQEQADALAQIDTDINQLQQSGDLPTDAVSDRLRMALCTGPDGQIYSGGCRSGSP